MHESVMGVAHANSRNHRSSAVGCLAFELLGVNDAVTMVARRNFPLQGGGIMKLQSLHDLFVDELRDLYNAETQLTKALPKMAKAAKSDDLRMAFESHLKETEGQVERLESIFEQIETTPKGKKCQAMAGLIEEGKEMID